MDKENLIAFLENTLDLLRNDKLNESQQEILFKFYENNTDRDILKYLFTGWYIYNQNSINNNDIIING